MALIKYKQLYSVLIAAILGGGIPSLGRCETLPTLVAHYRDRPPAMITYCGDRHDGPLRRILEEAASQIRHRIEWKHVPSLATSFKALKESEADIVPYIYIRTEEREKIFRFSESLGKKRRPVSFVLRDDIVDDILSFEDVKKYKIGYLKNIYFFDEFNEDDSLDKVVFSDPVSLARSFSKGDLDVAIVINRGSTERSFYSVGFDKFRYSKFTYSVSPEPDLYYLYSQAENRQPVFDQLDEVIQRMKENGDIKDIYLSFDAEPPT